MSDYGFVITTFNDAEQAVEMFESLKANMDSEPVLSIIDGGSNDENLKIIEDKIGKINGTHKDLPSALNLGFDDLINRGVGYIHWLHSDMRYFQHNWAEKLVKIYKYLWPLVGRMSPGTSNIDCSVGCLQQGEYLRHGNSCPVLMSSEFVQIVKDRYGFLYDPTYINISGFEDLCLWQRIAQMGYMSAICSLVDVWHVGAGVRANRDTNADQLYGRNVYHSKWGEKMGPDCDFDLKEVNEELGETFKHLKEEVISLVPERNKITEKLKDKFYKRDYNQ